jgi:hypothetical protein
MTIREITGLGDGQVLVVTGARFKGKGSGIEVNGVSYAVLTVSRGLIVRIDEFTERSEALEAVGLSE